MKYGLTYYKYTDNLGDDILSYASKRFLPQVDYYIDRESLDIFVPNETEYVATILNGWFLHRSYAFPPSPYILPLFIGIHFSTDHIAFGDYSWLNGYVTDYLKQYEPIGCRDTNTLQAVQSRQVNSFFSGCLTMTLEPFSGVKKTNTIILTDVPIEVKTYVDSLCPGDNIMIKTHTLQEHEQNLEWYLREKRVEEYLRLYQSAKLILTTRLHCALPAIALGTPVIIVGDYNDDFKDRIADYTKFCRLCDSKSILNGDADDFILNSFVNEDISFIRKELNEYCNNFISKAEIKASCSLNDLPKREQYLELYVNRTAFLRQSIEQLFNNHINLHQKYQQEHDNYMQLTELSQRLMDQYQRLLT